MIGRICALGIVEAGSIVSNNYALSMCSVFTNQSIKACVPLVLLAFRFRPSEVRPVHLSVIFAVSAICNLLSSDKVRDTMPGIWLSVLSLLCVVLRMHLAQQLLLVTGVSKSVVLFYQSGVAFFLLLLISVFNGAESIPADAAVTTYLVLSAVVAAIYNMAYIPYPRIQCPRDVVIGTGARGSSFMSMLKDVRVDLGSLLLVGQLVLSVAWYNTSHEEMQGFVRDRLTHTGRQRARTACRCFACGTAILTMPFVYDLARKTDVEEVRLDVSNLSMTCTTGFDGSSNYEIMVSRFGEDNLEVLCAQRRPGGPHAFHQAVDGDEHVPPSISRLTER